MQIEFLLFCSLFKHTPVFRYTSPMTLINIVVTSHPDMILSISKANSGANGFCNIWVLCKMFSIFFPYPNIPICSSTPSLWSPLLLLCLLSLPWRYPQLRPTLTHTLFRLIDCCVIFWSCLDMCMEKTGVCLCALTNSLRFMLRERVCEALGGCTRRARRRSFSWWKIDVVDFDVVPDNKHDWTKGRMPARWCSPAFWLAGW